ncbi:MAG: hypothetical protein K0S86_5140 [Geminicoccaceae bacterium]|jgi:hypothetical protein|nr:hypothetical protein [Geminicoccaceae bacterium]
MAGRDDDRSALGATIRRHLRAAFTERLGYKAAALFFAVVLWLVVSAEEPSEELVPVRLETAHDSARVLVGSRPAIRALVAGRARDLIKLYDTPPVVRKRIGDDDPDTVAVVLTPDDVFVPPDVEAIVRDVQPRSFVLVFDVTTSRLVPVKNEVRVLPDTGGAPRPTPVVRILPESVTITGPRRLVSTVSSVSTMDHTVAVGDSAEFIIPLDTTKLARSVRVRPPEVRLSVVRPTIGRPRTSAQTAQTPE